MKNYCALILLLSSSISTMDLKESPVDDNDKLQFNAPNQSTTSLQLETICKKYPNLQIINIPDHTIEQLPTYFSAPHLVKITLKNGSLNNADTVKQLLTSCINLKDIYIAHNKLTTINESQLPFHNNLEILDCSSNQITEFNFTTFKNMMPNLRELNLSGCPLANFEAQDLLLCNMIPNVNLKNTNLSNTTKKHIIAASKVIELSYGYNSPGFRTPRGCNIILSCIAGGVTGMMIGVPFVMLITLIPHSPLLDLNVGASLLLTVGSPAVAGAAISYISSIGCRKPEEREITVFNPIFDAEPDYTEEEVTTRYQRFIRHFPYFFSTCDSNNSESTPLTKVITTK